MRTTMPNHSARFRYAGVARRPLKETVTMDLALVVSPRLDAAVAAALLKSMRGLLAGRKGGDGRAPLATG
jgi:hypothetical protein